MEEKVDVNLTHRRQGRGQSARELGAVLKGHGKRLTRGVSRLLRGRPANPAAKVYPARKGPAGIRLTGQHVPGRRDSR